MNLRVTNNSTDSYIGNIYLFAVDPTTTPTGLPIQPTYTINLPVYDPSDQAGTQVDVPYQVVEGGQIHVFCAVDDGVGGYAAVTDLAVAGGADLHRIHLMRNATIGYGFQYFA